MNKFKENDMVYFISGWNEYPLRGVIKTFTMLDNTKYAIISGITIIGTWTVKLENVYTTEKECMDAIQNKNDAIKQKYMDGIKSIQDLVKFMYGNMDCENWNEKEVAKIKTKELLNIDLDKADD